MSESELGKKCFWVWVWDKTLPQQQNDVAEKVVAARSNQVGLYKIYEEVLLEISV